ncbi:MAG: S8 family serine peptidase, partial [Bdellovibrionales bacterium]|nr:S8 family serine peptidase [Bdellovibrionales bacterium]
MFKPLYRAIMIVGLALILSACGTPQSGEPVFQKAEGYTCTESAIKNEYLVRLRSGEIKVIHAESDEDFLSDYFEPNKDLIQTAEPNYNIQVKDFEILARAPGEKIDNWGTSNIGATKYWSQNEYGKDMIVSVIDTGVDLDHEQLKDQILENPGEMGLDKEGQDKRFNGIDDDENGYVDDWKGYDFYYDRGLIGDNGASGHGTHVAGIIAAKHNSTSSQASEKLFGVAPKVKILPASFLGPEGGGTINGAIEAIRYSVKRGAKIINASWGSSGCSVALKEEVQGLSTLNVIFVSAAGNEFSNLDTWPEYPASFEGVTQLTVGSIDSDLKKSAFSNYSSRFVQLVAPGGKITSTVPKGVEASGYLTYSGTSMATPF